MSDLLARLQRDHGNFARLDALLEQQAALMDRGEMADFRLISDIMRYMTVYPNVSHHSLEDLILAKLAERAPEMRTLAQDLQDEHRRLTQVGRVFADLVNAVMGGGITPIAKVRAMVWEYLQLSRSHAVREETEAFPEVARILTEEDWQKLSETIHSATDPLFGGVVDHSYQILFETIERSR